MNEVYEIMKQIDVIVIFSLICGLAWGGILCMVCDIFCYVAKKVKNCIARRKEKKSAQKNDVNK